MASARLVGIIGALWISTGVVSASGQNLQPTQQGRTTQTEPAAAAAAYIEPGRIIQQVDPIYPSQAKRRFVQGSVELKATVTKDGSVTNVALVRGNPILAVTATNAVAQWKYLPCRVDGVAIAADTTIDIDYIMGSESLGASNGLQTVVHAPPVLPEGVTAPERTSLPPPPPGLMRISGRVMAAQLDKKAEPVYPADSIALDARGTVLLLATIKKTGEVSEVQFVSGPQRFRGAAVAAVKQWTYRPYLVDENAADVQTSVALEFAPPK